MARAAERLRPAPQVGVELAQRTGRSPNFQYLQLGCSKQAERAMLNFAHAQRGKPFSMMAMVRSVVWPRKTNLNNYYCAGTPRPAPEPAPRDGSDLPSPCPQSSSRRPCRRAT
jgi:hypothetical protein